MKEQLKETLTKFVTIKTEEQKRRLIAGFSFGGLCGLMAAIGGIEYLFISGMFAIVYATGLVGGYYIYTKHQYKETVEE